MYVQFRLEIAYKTKEEEVEDSIDKCINIVIMEEEINEWMGKIGSTLSTVWE